MFFYAFYGFLLFITLIKSQIFSTNLTNITDIIIKENVTSNYFYSTFNFGTNNVSIPYAINQCTAYNILNNRLKAECMSKTLLNVTYYGTAGCTGNIIRREIINDTSLFRCNASNNYATILMGVGTACPGFLSVAVAIGYCHNTGSTYANLLCENNYLQYVYYSDELCTYPNLMAINDANKSCDQFFTVNSIDIYGAVQECVTNLTANTYVIPTTTTFMTSTRINATNVNATNVNATNVNATSGANATSVGTTSSGITTSAGGSHVTSEPSTTRHRRRRVIPGIPTIVRNNNGASTILNFNNILFIILISSIVNIFC